MEDIIRKYIMNHKALEDAANLRETLWINPGIEPFDQVKDTLPLSLEEIHEAEERLRRFAPLIEEKFPDTRADKGIIESPLQSIFNMQRELEKAYDLSGKLYLKMDSHLAVAGSIKARGGIYEVLKHTEELALEHDLITTKDNYIALASKGCREFFSQYTIQVGSTGNLGLSIGITSAAIGYRVIVHMSKDAKAWKKELLRSKGVEVVEYESDYSLAVKEGRRESEKDPMSYFVDDENSKDLFLGYAVAAHRLQKQLKDQGIVVDSNHPLFVYIPCGVGGAPGGVAYGLKAIFKEDVHCFFVEPTHAPCMLVGMASGLHDQVSVQDFGIDGITEADGLAVARASGFVGRIMEPLLSGIFTIDDDRLFDFMRLLDGSQGIRIEPSACAAFMGPAFLEKYGRRYLTDHQLGSVMDQGTHIAWATGGSLVPQEAMERYLQKNYKKG